MLPPPAASMPGSTALVIRNIERTLTAISRSHSSSYSASDCAARALSAGSAVQSVESTYGMPVLAIANLNDLLRFLNSESSLAAATTPRA